MIKRAIIAAAVLPLHCAVRSFDAIAGLSVSRASLPTMYGGTANPGYPLNPLRVQWGYDSRGRVLYAFGFEVTNQAYSQTYNHSLGATVAGLCDFVGGPHG